MSTVSKVPNSMAVDQRGRVVAQFELDPKSRDKPCDHCMYAQPIYMRLKGHTCKIDEMPLARSNAVRRLNVFHDAEYMGCSYVSFYQEVQSAS